MKTIHIRCSGNGFSVDGDIPDALGFSQRLAISRAVDLAEPTAIRMHNTDPETYQFSPKAPSFVWMTLGLTETTLRRLSSVIDSSTQRRPTKRR
jgi:hypothetical protein